MPNAPGQWPCLKPLIDQLAHQLRPSLARGLGSRRQPLVLRAVQSYGECLIHRQSVTRRKTLEVRCHSWLLAGQSHHSVVVEFADHLTLVEAPQHDTRSLAVIEKARALRPGKPLTEVVNTHHHFDHSGGIRAAVSEGLTVITHKGNAEFFEDIVKRAHTVSPDALARKPQALKIKTVDDTLELKDTTRTLRLFHVMGSPHASTMSMAYLPQENMLIEVDVFRGVASFAANLLENVTTRGLAVTQIIPLHGTPAPFSELQQAARPLAGAN